MFPRNCQIAFSLAESQLDIPSLLDIQDILETGQLDRRSLLTYLAQFYHKFAGASRPELSKTEINSTQSLPPTLNSPAVTVRDKTAGSNIAAIKQLVFNTRAQTSEPTGSDSGLEQEPSSESSSPSSRLSSVSPSFNQNNSRDLAQTTPAPTSVDKLKSRKYPANMIIKPKRTHISVNNRIDQNRPGKYSQGKRNTAASFQEAFIKFNSLSLSSSGAEQSPSQPESQSVQKAEIKQLRSQSCQTERLGSSTSSQHSQTDQSHLRPGQQRPDWEPHSTPFYKHHHHHLHHRNNNYNYVHISSGIPFYSTLV